MRGSSGARRAQGAYRALDASTRRRLRETLVHSHEKGIQQPCLIQPCLRSTPCTIIYVDIVFHFGIPWLICTLSPSIPSWWSNALQSSRVRLHGSTVFDICGSLYDTRVVYKVTDYFYVNAALSWHGSGWSTGRGHIGQKYYWPKSTMKHIGRTHL